jgi:hypothetical protein
MGNIARICNRHQFGPIPGMIAATFAHIKQSHNLQYNKMKELPCVEILDVHTACVDTITLTITTHSRSIRMFFN